MFYIERSRFKTPNLTPAQGSSSLFFFFLQRKLDLYSYFFFVPAKKSTLVDWSTLDFGGPGPARRGLHGNNGRRKKNPKIKKENNSKALYLLSAILTPGYTRNEDGKINK